MPHLETPVTSPHLAVPTQITVVHAPACHLCDDAVDALERLAQDIALEVRVVDLESSEGALLVSRHRPAMNPLVLLDGEYFSSGRLPRTKLVRLLEREGRA